MKLEALFEEIIRAENSIELLIGIYRVAKGDLIRSLKKHPKETNPMVDHPTYRVLKIILQEEEEMLAWGEHALNSLIITDEDRIAADRWQKHLESYLHAAGGISGELEKPVVKQSIPRSDGNRYEMNVQPKRDHRFADNYNASAKIV